MSSIQRNSRRVGVIAGWFGALMLAGSCGSSTTATPDGGSTLTCANLTRTCSEVAQTFAAMSTSGGWQAPTLNCNDGDATFQVRSTGIPNYDSNQTTPNQITDQGWTFSIPLSPRCGQSTTDVRSSRGPIGVLINGVPFYGPENATGQDAVVAESATFDACNGHADMQCRYHNHSEPTCVFGLATSIGSKDASDGHSAVIGYALDGFALYGPKATAAEPSLDACNGHFEAGRGYHYHLTLTSPYLIGCYRGDTRGSALTGRNPCTP